MAKTKKMGFGGFLGGVLGGGAKAVKKAISKSPAKTLAGGVGAAKPSMGAAGVLAKNAVKSPAKAVAGGVAAGGAQKQFMSDKLRGASSLAPGLGPRGATVGGGRPGPRTPRDIGTGSMPRPGGIPKPGGMGPRPPSQVSGKPVGLGRAMSKPTGVGIGMGAKKIAGAGAGMAKAVMGRKAGGTVKKAAKK
jgi:hypothetical protein